MANASAATKGFEVLCPHDPKWLRHMGHGFGGFYCTDGCGLVPECRGCREPATVHGGEPLCAGCQAGTAIGGAS